MRMPRLKGPTLLQSSRWVEIGVDWGIERGYGPGSTTRNADKNSTDDKASYASNGRQ